MPNPLRRLLSTPPRRIERDVIQLALDDDNSIEIERVRDPRARRIRLSVGDRGARLTLPARASLVSGQRFAHEHRQWLVEQLASWSDPGVTPLLPDRTALLPLRGESLPLRWADGRYTRVVHADDGLVMQRPASAGPAALARALRDFYEAEARADLGRWLPAYLPGLPAAPSRIRLRQMSSQWGSLAPNGAMSIDLALVLGRPDAFEYVLVHELCHLIHANHSRAFWHEVELRCPDWRRHRDYFRGEGSRLKATLRTLLSPPACPAG